MQSAATRSPAPSHVTALFNDGSHTFLMPKGSTLGELAERIRELSSFYEGDPIAIHVDFETPRLRTLKLKPSPHVIFN